MSVKTHSEFRLQTIFGLLQLSSLEAQLAEKMAQLSVLQAENQRLQVRTRILEVVIRARDEQACPW
jgi:hypothetical protein